MESMIGLHLEIRTCNIPCKPKCRKSQGIDQQDNFIISADTGFLAKITSRLTKKFT